MKYMILAFILLHCFGAHAGNGVPRYKTQKRSIIQWSQLDPNEWLDYKAWKYDLKEKQKWPNWEKSIRERRLKEMAGRIIECVGHCHILRGDSRYKVGYRSKLMEGDEFQTKKNSYAWIFLLDGTLIRVSPESSISLREFNIGIEENFNYVRVNRGQIYWLSREEEKFEIDRMRETDSLFLPLTYLKANPSLLKYGKLQQTDTLEIGDQLYLGELQGRRANRLIKLNNEYYQFRKSFNFIVLPNGSVSGSNLHFEITVLEGGKTYFKQLTSKFIRLKKKETSSLKFYFRGYLNTKTKSIEPNKWYEASRDGRSLEEVEGNSLMQMSTYVKKRIPSIIVTRELYLRKYADFVFSLGLEKSSLASEHGYRLWGKRSEQGSDYSRHFSFLKEYTRRIETTNLSNFQTLQLILRKRGEEYIIPKFDRRYFNKAIQNYYQRRKTKIIDLEDPDAINSTRRKYWKNIHGIY